VGHEQEGGLASVGDLRGVVERGHDRLARAGGCDEEVSMMTPRAGQCDLLEQTRLERQRVQLGRRQGDPVAASLAPRSGGELGCVVVDEIVVLPVRFEDRPYLADDVRIACRRDAHVPFEPVDLRHLREVGGTDVGGREAGVPVEQPRLRMQSRTTGVVGDPNGGTRLHQGVQRRGLRGAGVDRRQQSDRAARRREPTQAVE